MPLIAEVSVKRDDGTLVHLRALEGQDGVWYAVSEGGYGEARFSYAEFKMLLEAIRDRRKMEV